MLLHTMGLEYDEVEQIVSKGLEPSQIKSRLRAAGWREVDFGFHLGRKSHALDIQKGQDRALVYPSTGEDILGQELLVGAKIPQIISFRFPNPLNYSIAPIPEGTRALDSLSFPDTEPKTGYLGSIEVLRLASQLLKQLHERLSLGPHQLELNKLALIPRERLPIRLVPPIYLVPTTRLALLQQISEDLKRQDPSNDHATQLAVVAETLGV